VIHGSAMRKTTSAVLAGALIGALAFTGGTAEAASTANAAAPLSQSTARVLSGTIGGTSLDTIAEAAGTSAQNFGGATVNKDVTPDVGVLNDALVVPLGALKGSLTSAVPGLSLQGLVEQKVRAAADGSARGDASVAGLGLDLGTLTGGNSNSILSLTLGLGAVTSFANQAAGADGAQTGGCTVAGLGLDLTSPLVSSLISNLTNALSPVSQLIATLEAALNGLPNNIVTITGLPTVASLISSLGTISVLDGGITLNLATGSLHIDLAKVLEAAGLDFCSAPNTEVLPALIDALTNDLLPLLHDTINSTVESLTHLLRLCDAQVTSDCITIKVAGVDVSTILGSTLTTVTNTLTDLVTSLLGATGSVTGILGSLGSTLLTPLVNALSGLIDIKSNVQTTSNGTFSETALQLTLLQGLALPTVSGFAAPGDALLVVNLSNATVGPSSVAPVTSSSTPPPSTSTPPIKINAGRPGSGGVGTPLLWVGIVLLIGGSGGAFLFRMRAARHS